MRNTIVIIILLFISQAALMGQTATIFNGNPALEFRSEEGTARIVRVTGTNGYPVLVFSVAHFHVIGQCYGSLYVSAGVRGIRGIRRPSSWSVASWGIIATACLGARTRKAAIASS